MLLTNEETRDLYRKRALRYDLAFWVYRMLGFRENHYRKRTVSSLKLSAGDRVVDVACGTGRNFSFLEEAVGSEGEIIGVDLTDTMLAQAKARVASSGWSNVRLVESDAAKYDFPKDLDAVVSTLALALVPEYDLVVLRAAGALRPGGRLAVLDMKMPERWPLWLARFAAWLNKPYGVSIELADRHPWESMRQYLHTVSYREFYGGVLYLAVGEAR